MTELMQIAADCARAVSGLRRSETGSCCKCAKDCFKVACRFGQDCRIRAFSGGFNQPNGHGDRPLLTVDLTDCGISMDQTCVRQNFAAATWWGIKSAEHSGDSLGTRA